MKLDFSQVARLSILGMALALVPFTMPASGQSTDNSNQAGSNSSGYHKPSGGNNTGSAADESNHPVQADQNASGASAQNAPGQNNPGTPNPNPTAAPGEPNHAGQTQRAQTNAGGGGGGWGLFGLIGLLGLFGLARRPAARVDTRARDENIRRIA